MIVADISLIASLFLDTAFTTLAKVHKKVPTWIFPSLWKEEFANVLAKFTRKDTSKTTVEVIAHFEYTLAELGKYERKVNLSSVLKVALERKISVYDAHFVQLAIDEQMLLVTEDKEIIKKCPDLALSMHDFLHHSS